MVASGDDWSMDECMEELPVCQSCLEKKETNGQLEKNLVRCHLHPNVTFSMGDMCPVCEGTYTQH